MRLLVVDTNVFIHIEKTGQAIELWLRTITRQ